MKRLSLLLCGILISCISFSQKTYYTGRSLSVPQEYKDDHNKVNDGFCGTRMSDEMLNWLKAYKQSGAPANKQGPDSTLYYIPLKIHIVGTNDGGGYHKVSSILDGLCKLNEQYEQVGFHFYIEGEFDYINSDALYDHADYNVGSIINQHKTPNAANIYYVQNPAGNCGYFSPYRDYVAVAKSCAGSSNSTVAHELGHFFSLPHTFNGWEGRATTEAPQSDDELVARTNCSDHGDNFCDTPADFISDRWGCPYSNTKVDFAGTPYAVDGSLYMSYANDACQNKFSPEQIDAMRAYLLSNRSELLNHPMPILDTLGSATNIYPANGAIGVPANFVQLKWNKAVGATHYNLQVTRYFNGNFSNIDIVTTDTTYLITDLEPSYNYRWRVRPFNQGNTCSSYTPYSNFVTRTATAIVPQFTVNNISCVGQTDGSISIGASGGTGPYSFEWSTGSTGQSLNNLTEGNYFLTITDSAGADSLVIAFDVTEPVRLDAQIMVQNTVLNAVAVGGTPPFTYQWSNGVTVAQTTMTDLGEYTITVTDSRGCSTTKAFFYTGIATIDVNDTRIYPNPLQSGEVLTVQLTAPENFKGAIQIFDNTGRSVMNIDKQFTSGKNTETFNLPALAKGIYFLRITGDGVQGLNRKLIVY